MTAIRTAILIASLIGCVDPDAVLNPTVENEPVQIVAEEPEEEWVSLGVMKITAYDGGACCCGKYANGYTASGTVATAGRTIGVNPRIIPYGTEVMIDGHVYVAEDTGGSSKQRNIDIFYNTHEEALAQGVLKREVFVKC